MRKVNGVSDGAIDGEFGDIVQALMVKLESHGDYPFRGLQASIIPLLTKPVERRLTLSFVAYRIQPPMAWLCI
jgi:hypothetical protein